MCCLVLFVTRQCRTSFPCLAQHSAMSHVIPLQVFQIMKLGRWNCNVFGWSRKMTEGNYVRNLSGLLPAVHRPVIDASPLVPTMQPSTMSGTEPRPTRVSSLHSRCSCRGRGERTPARESCDSRAGSMRRQCRPRGSVLLRELGVCPDGVDANVALAALSLRRLRDDLQLEARNRRDVDAELLRLVEG